MGDDSWAGGRSSSRGRSPSSATVGAEVSGVDAVVCEVWEGSSGAGCISCRTGGASEAAGRSGLDTVVWKVRGGAACSGAGCISGGRGGGSGATAGRRSSRGRSPSSGTVGAGASGLDAAVCDGGGGSRGAGCIYGG